MLRASHGAPERTGNDWQALSRANAARIEDALVGVKRAALAEDIGVSEGQLSKLLNGELKRFARICGRLGLAVVPEDYLRALERVLKERL